MSKPAPGRLGVSRRKILSAGAAAAAALPALPSLAATTAATTVSSTPIDPDWEPQFFSAQQGQVVGVLCDIILPKTDTPSATEAGVHRYIDEALLVGDTDDQLQFLGGLAWLENRCSAQFGTDLLGASQQQRIGLISEIADDRDQVGELETGAAFFDDLKRRTIFGYYTSRVGRTEALGLPETPRREQLRGCTHDNGQH